MNDISTAEMGLNIGSAVNERRERQVREGLSRQDESLPVGQNIARVYGHTPELWRLGEAIASGDEQLAQRVTDEVRESMEKYYGLKLVFKSSKEILKITQNPDNHATLRKKEIIVSEWLKDSSLDLAYELAHELGAARLIEIYGEKERIPSGLPTLYEDVQSSPATHYLDEYVQSVGSNREIIATARLFVWDNGRLIQRI